MTGKRGSVKKCKFLETKSRNQILCRKDQLNVIVDSYSCGTFGSPLTISAVLRYDEVLRLVVVGPVL